MAVHSNWPLVNIPQGEIPWIEEERKVVPNVKIPFIDHLFSSSLPFSYVKFAMNKVNMLKYHGITPYIVFDGGPLPAKAKTETDRAA